MAIYDYPLNERVRTLLRLEDLFVKVLHHTEQDDEFNHHNALLTIFQIMDVIDRAELKADLLQELDRQKSVMQSLRGNPSISEGVLNEVIQEISKTSQAMRNNPTKLGQSLRDHEWLMSIKQRVVIPGGVCQFDVPSYHFWFGLGVDRRRKDLKEWLEPVMPIYDSVRIIMHILRGSGVATKQLAPAGAFQQMLGGAKPAQMLRVEVADDLNGFPEVSANKYAINVRFYTLESTEKHTSFSGDAEFSLTLCNL